MTADTPHGLTDEERQALIRAIDDSYSTNGHFPLRPVVNEVERILAARADDRERRTPTIGSVGAAAARADDAAATTDGWTINGRPVEVANGRLVEPGRTLCVHNVGLDTGLWCGGCTDALRDADRRADVRYQQGWADGYAAALSAAPVRDTEDTGHDQDTVARVRTATRRRPAPTTPPAHAFVSDFAAGWHMALSEVRAALDGVDTDKDTR